MPFMTQTRRGVLLGGVTYLCAWGLAALVVWEAIARATDVHTAMRLVPYSNPHLMEEIAQGEYNPWRDYVFLLRVLLVSAAPILAGTWVGGRFGGRPAAIRIACAGLLVLVLLNWQVLSTTAQPVLRTAFLGELGVASICAGLAAWLAGNAEWARGGPTSGCS
jgi:hypothetical protein